MAYGIEVYDTDGSTTVLSNTTRYLNRLIDPVQVTGVSSHTFLENDGITVLDATGLSASNCAVVILGTNPNTSWTTAFNGTSGITITSTFGDNFSATFTIFRY